MMSSRIFLDSIRQKSNYLLSLAKSHHNSILIVLSLGIACFSTATLLKLQKVSEETGVTLEKYREVLIERSVEAAVVEESLGNSTIVKYGAIALLGLSFFFLSYLAWVYARDNFPGGGTGDGPPEGVAGSVEPQMGGRLDDSFVSNLNSLIDRFSEELTQLDFSALVSENFTGPALELIAFCLT